MFNFIEPVIQLLLISQIPTFNPITLGPLTIGPINPGLFTTTTPRILTRPIETTTTPRILTRPLDTTSTSSLTASSNVLDTFNDVTNNENPSYLAMYITFPILGALLIIGIVRWFIKRKKNISKINVESVDRLYASIDYSTVYELPKPEPPPVPKNPIPTYGVQVISSI